MLAYNKTLPLDLILKENNLFSKRVTNTLIRQGIVTPRLLLMFSRDLLLRSDIRNLGRTGLAEIQDVLKVYGLGLSTSSDDGNATIFRLLTIALSRLGPTASIELITKQVNVLSHIAVWKESEVLAAASEHPYVYLLENGCYTLRIQSPDSVQVKLVSESQPTIEEHLLVKQDKVLLSQLWNTMLHPLNEAQQETLMLCYGVHGEQPYTLQEVGEEFEITRERVRQIRNRAVRKISVSIEHSYQQVLSNLVLEGLELTSNLLRISEWEQLLDKKVIWEHDEPRPSLLHLLCDLIEEIHYLKQFDVATTTDVQKEDLDKLYSLIKRVLRQHKKSGLAADELIQNIQDQLSSELPPVMHQTDFIIKSISLFERVGQKKDGRYYYLYNKAKAMYPAVGSGWLGKPGTRLYKWEINLRERFENIAWIGQMRLTEADFVEMCYAIQEEAQSPNYFSKIMEGQPRLVPPAVFVTTMVLSARYAELKPDDAADEFWHPYLHNVWEQEYTQAFYARCKKRFNEIVPYFEEKYGFEFPRMGKSYGEVITPIYRHALIPHYLQSDFSTWLYENWERILDVAETPTELATYLQTDHSIERYPHRLQHFIKDDATAETAASLITSMAVAISMYVEDGESIESIDTLLSDTPIEQELWTEIAQKFTQQRTLPSLVARTHRLQINKPRVTWIWSLDEDELSLRVQNIIVPATHPLKGELDRLVWLENANDDPLSAEIEVEVTPWKMKTGEKIVQDVVITEPDGPLHGVLLLLTDYDEVVVKMDIPPHPSASIQFYRITQQGAYGIPVDLDGVNEGEVLVCAKHLLSFVDEDNELIEPDNEYSVPYPLDNMYVWAARFTLGLPAKVLHNDKELLSIGIEGKRQPFEKVTLVGTNPLDISRQVQPTFVDTDVYLKVHTAQTHILKQASLWIKGQNGWRWQQTLTELSTQGDIEWFNDDLHIDLGNILPLRPDLYAIELRSGLQPLLSAPLQFAIIPNLRITVASPEAVYTTIKPFRLKLAGVGESAIVRAKTINVNVISDESQEITWTDLRHEPRMILRFGDIDIPLAWSIPRFSMWLEPKPTKSYMTIGELYNAKLHVVNTCEAIHTFRLLVQSSARTIALKRGRITINIGKNQLYDMVKRIADQKVQVQTQVLYDTWSIFEVWRHPELQGAEIEYVKQEQILIFTSDLVEDWPGNYQFFIEDLTNPLAPIEELGRSDSLKDVHFFPVALTDGVYQLHLELDSKNLSVSAQNARFTVGDSSHYTIRDNELAHEMRKGTLIPPHLAEEFVLHLVEMAETRVVELTSDILYQLSTTSASAYENFSQTHLSRLWTTLAALQAVHDIRSWRESQGLLPANILLPQPVILKTVDHEVPLKVYPIQVLDGGRIGKGYARWRIAAIDAPKELVYVQWQPSSNYPEREIGIEAGIPENIPENWASIDLEDTYGLHYCPRCGYLTGVRSFDLPSELRKAHFHGRSTDELGDIMRLEEHDEFSLLAEFFLHRRGRFLTDIYQEHGIICPSAADYFPEPPLSIENVHIQRHTDENLYRLVRLIMQSDVDRGAGSPWASAARLLEQWNADDSVSKFGQSVFPLAMLLRTAAYEQQEFCRILTDSLLSENLIKNLLSEINEISPLHLQWALTWAELLIVHSPTGYKGI